MASENQNRFQIMGPFESQTSKNDGIKMNLVGIQGSGIWISTTYYSGGSNTEHVRISDGP